MNEKILTTDNLNYENLNKLQIGELLAIRIPDFYPKATSEELAERMTGSNLFGKYINAPEIGRVGQAFFECLNSDEQKEKYHNNACNWINEMRNYSSPYLSPIDKLRLTLDESWPGGAHLGAIEGKKMFVGLARIFSSGSSAEPHQDILSWDAPDSVLAQSLQGQVAANIYLKIPVSGGALKIWPKKLSFDLYQNCRIKNSYGINTESLSCDPVEIYPQVGELILFNCTFIHAVSPSSDNRVTWSCFVGNRSQVEPLMVWS